MTVFMKSRLVVHQCTTTLIFMQTFISFLLKLEGRILFLKSSLLTQFLRWKKNNFSIFLILTCSFHLCRLNSAFIKFLLTQTGVIKVYSIKMFAIHTSNQGERKNEKNEKGEQECWFGGGCLESSEMESGSWRDCC